MNRNPAGDTPAGDTPAGPGSRSRLTRVAVPALLVLAVVAAATVAATALARRSAREPVPTRTIPAFDGIELSALQRTRVGLIQGRHADEMRAIQEHMAPALSALRAARRQGDTTAGRLAWERMASDRAALKAVGAKVRAEIREVLTPEQRARFDANSAALEARAADLDRRNGMPTPPAQGARGVQPPG
jgi:Spy/CpxP family protein refolding chaperone